jgi:hypothetical protein
VFTAALFHNNPKVEENPDVHPLKNGQAKCGGKQDDILHKKEQSTDACYNVDEP